MKSNTKAFFTMLVVMSMCNLSFAQGNDLFYSDSEPKDGIRGIKWGTDISTFSGMKYIETEPSYGGTEIYQREKEELMIDGVKIQKIDYYFWRGQFRKIQIVAKGWENWTGLKETIKGRYPFFFQDIEIGGLILEEEGKKHYQLPGLDIYRMKNKEVWIEVAYQDNISQSSIDIYSVEVQKKIDKAVEKD